MIRLRSIWPLIVFLTGCGTIQTGIHIPNTASAARPSDWFSCDSYRNATALGININNLSFSALQSSNLINALQQSHVGWIRISLFWAWIERQPGKFDWQAVDDGLAILANAHINVLLTLDGPVPCWALTASTKCTSPRYTVPPTSEWVDFVTQAVSRYQNQVHYWEIWNEPDLIEGLDVQNSTSRLIQYRDNILIPTARIIHLVDPNAKVVGPAFAAIQSGNTASGPELESAMFLLFANSAVNMIDVISLHSYYPESAVAKASTVQNVLNTTGVETKPIWITEEGDGTQNIQSHEDIQADQAQFLNNEIIAEKNAGNIGKVFWFALTDSANINGAHTNDYGLINNQDYVTYNWTPRSTFITLQSLIQDACKAN